jgi:hypothetical protein
LEVEVASVAGRLTATSSAGAPTHCHLIKVVCLDMPAWIAGDAAHE